MRPKQNTQKSNFNSPFARKNTLQEIHGLIQSGSLQEAMKKVEPLTKRGSKDPDAWRLRAMIAEKMHNPVEVARCAQKALAIVPSVHAYMLHASSHRPEGRTDEAVACCVLRESACS